MAAVKLSSELTNIVHVLFSWKTWLESWESKHRLTLTVAAATSWLYGEPRIAAFTTPPVFHCSIWPCRKQPYSSTGVHRAGTVSSMANIHH
jgi:hypothetical protein